MVRRPEDDVVDHSKMPFENKMVQVLNNEAKLVIYKAYGFRATASYDRDLRHRLGDLPLPKTAHTSS